MAPKGGQKRPRRAGKGGAGGLFSVRSLQRKLGEHRTDQKKNFSNMHTAVQLFRLERLLTKGKGRCATVKEKEESVQVFCRQYLQCLDPQQAAACAGCRDGYSLLELKNIQKRLERMREAAAGQIRREDAVRRLAQLAFGRVNDAARLALHNGEADLEALDLSAVAELKVTDKGGVEIRLIDRVRALETLCGLLERDGEDAGTLYQALADAAGGERGWDDD